MINDVYIESLKEEIEDLKAQLAIAVVLIEEAKPFLDILVDEIEDELDESERHDLIVWNNGTREFLAEIKEKV